MNKKVLHSYSLNKKFEKYNQTFITVNHVVSNHKKFFLDIIFPIVLSYEHILDIDPLIDYTTVGVWRVKYKNQPEN